MRTNQITRTIALAMTLLGVLAVAVRVNHAMAFDLDWDDEPLPETW